MIEGVGLGQFIRYEEEGEIDDICDVDKVFANETRTAL